VPDQVRALEEIYRVLVQGGGLLMADHGEYTRFPARVFERRGDHPRRLPRKIAEEVGFRIGHHDRTLLGFVERVVAHRPCGVCLFNGRMDGSPTCLSSNGLYVLRARSL